MEEQTPWIDDIGLANTRPILPGPKVQIINPSTGKPYNPISPSRVRDYSRYLNTDVYDNIKPLNDYDQGFNPIFDNNQEAYRSNNQSATNQILSGLGRFALTTLTKTGAGLASIPAAADALINWDINKLTDNPVVKSFDRLEEEIKNTLPIYKSLDYQTGNILDKMMTTSFWADDAVDGAAFMASAYLQSGLMSGLTKGVKALDVLDDAVKAGAAGEVTGNALTKGLVKMGIDGRAIERGAITSFNTITEAAGEARDSKKQVVEELNLKRRLGLKGVEEYKNYANMTDDDINIKASEAASSVFKTNMALLLLSNGVESGWFAKRASAKTETLTDIFKNKSRAEAEKAINDIYKQTKWNTRLGNNTLAGLKGFASEGLWEENVQNAVQEYFGTLNNTMNPEEAKYKANDFMKQIYNGFAGTAEAIWGLTPFGEGPEAGSDKDKAATAVMLGGILGGPMSYRNAVKEDKQQANLQKQLSNEYKSFVDLSNKSRNILLDTYASTLDKKDKTIPDPEDPTKSITIPSYYSDDKPNVNPDKMNTIFFNLLTDQRMANHDLLASMKGDNLWGEFNKQLQLFRVAWQLENSKMDEDQKKILTKLMFSPNEKEVSKDNQELMNDFLGLENQMNDYRQSIKQSKLDANSSLDVLSSIKGKLSYSEAFTQQLEKNLAFTQFNIKALNNLLNTISNLKAQADIQAEIKRNTTLYNELVTKKNKLQNEYAAEREAKEFDSVIKTYQESITEKANKKEALKEQLKKLSVEDDIDKANEIQKEIENIDDELTTLNLRIKEKQKVFGIIDINGLEEYDKTLSNVERKPSLRNQEIFNDLLVKEKYDALEEAISNNDIDKALSILDNFNSEELNKLPKSSLDLLRSIQIEKQKDLRANNDTIKDIKEIIDSLQLTLNEGEANDYFGDDLDIGEGSIGDLKDRLSEYQLDIDLSDADSSNINDKINTLKSNADLIIEGLKKENEESNKINNKLNILKNVVGSSNKSIDPNNPINDDEINRRGLIRFFMEELKEVIDLVNSITNNPAFTRDNLGNVLLSDQYDNATPLYKQREILEILSNIIRYIDKEHDPSIANELLNKINLIVNVPVDFKDLKNIIEASIKFKENYFKLRQLESNKLESNTNKNIKDIFVNKELTEFLKKVFGNQYDQIINILESNEVGDREMPYSASSLIALFSNIQGYLSDDQKKELISIFDNMLSELKAQIPLDESIKKALNTNTPLYSKNISALLKEAPISAFLFMMNQSNHKLMSGSKGFLNSKNPGNALYVLFKTYDINAFLKQIIVDKETIANSDNENKDKILNTLEALESIARIVMQMDALSFVRSLSQNNLDIDSFNKILDKWTEDNIKGKDVDKQRSPSYQQLIALVKAAQQIRVIRDNIKNKKIENVNNAVLLMGSAGTGKAQPLTSKIYTPDGYKLMKDIKINDEIFDDNGEIIKVLNVYPQGIKKLYKVTFTDGHSVECCDEHLWKVYTDKDRNWNQKHPLEEKKFTIIETKDMINNLYYISGKNNNRVRINYQIPVISKSVNFKEKALPINPYLLGVLIGDGSLTETINFTSTDNQIVDRISTIIEKDFKELKVNRISNTITYSISGKKGIKNKLRELIKSLNLNVKSEYKHIPKDYIYNSEKNRISLLQGLMDTDGTVSKSGVDITYSTSSYQLALDVCELCQSLGCVVTIKSKKTKKLTNYVVRINQNNLFDLFSLSRKLEKVIAKSKYKTVRYIKNIELLNPVEQQCIMVSGKSNLYLTDSFTVTHNTSVVLKLLYNYILSSGIYTESDIILTGHSKSSSKNVNDEFGRKADNSIEDIIANPDLIKDKKVIVLDEAFAAKNSQLQTLILNNKDKVFILLGDPSQTKGELNINVETEHNLSPSNNYRGMFLLPALTQNYRSFIPAVNETAILFQDRVDDVTIANTTSNLSATSLRNTSNEANGVIVVKESEAITNILSALKQRQGKDNRTRVIQVSNNEQVAIYNNLLKQEGITGVDVLLWQDAQGKTYDESYIHFDINKPLGKSGITSDKPGYNAYFNSAMYTAITRGRYFSMIAYNNQNVPTNVDNALSKQIDNSSEEKAFNTQKFIEFKIDLKENNDRFSKTSNVKVDDDKSLFENTNLVKEDIQNKIPKDTTVEENTEILDINEPVSLDQLEEENEEEQDVVSDASDEIEESNLIKEEVEQLKTALEESLLLRESNQVGVSLNYPQSANILGKDENGKNIKEYSENDDVVFVYSNPRDPQIFVVHRATNKVLGIWGPNDIKAFPLVNALLNSENIKSKKPVVYVGGKIDMDIEDSHIIAEGKLSHVSPLRYLYDQKNPVAFKDIKGFSDIVSYVTNMVVDTLRRRATDTDGLKEELFEIADGKIKLRDSKIGNTVTLKVATKSWADKLALSGNIALSKIVQKHKGKILLVIKPPVFVHNGKESKEGFNSQVVIMNSPMLTKEHPIINELKEFKALLDIIDHIHHRENKKYLTLGSEMFTLLHDAVVSLYEAVETDEGKPNIKLKDDLMNLSKGDLIGRILSHITKSYKESLDSKIVKEAELRLAQGKELTAHQALVAKKLETFKLFTKNALYEVLSSDEKRKETDPSYKSVLDAMQEMVTKQMLVGVDKKEKRKSFITLIEELDLTNKNSEYETSQTGEGDFIIIDKNDDTIRWIVPNSKNQFSYIEKLLNDYAETKALVEANPSKENEKSLSAIEKNIKKIGFVEQNKGGKNSDKWESKKQLSLVRNKGYIQKRIDNIARANEKVNGVTIRQKIVKQSNSKYTATGFPLLPTITSSSSLIGNIKKAFISHILSKYDFEKTSTGWIATNRRSEPHNNLRKPELRKLRNDMFYDLLEEYEGDTEAIIQAIEEAVSTMNIQQPDIDNLKENIESLIQEDLKAKQGSITSSVIEDIINNEEKGFGLVEPILVNNGGTTWTTVDDLNEKLQSNNPEKINSALETINNKFSTNLQSVFPTTVMLKVKTDTVEETTEKQETKTETKQSKDINKEIIYLEKLEKIKTASSISEDEITFDIADSLISKIKQEGLSEDDIEWIDETFKDLDIQPMKINRQVKGLSESQILGNQLTEDQAFDYLRKILPQLPIGSQLKLWAEQVLSKVTKKTKAELLAKYYPQIRFISGTEAMKYEKEGEKVWGFVKDKIIYLRNEGQLYENPLRHEAFHYIFKYYLTEEERTRLYNEASAIFEKQGLDFNALSLYDKEELLAEMFHNRKSLLGRKASIFNFLANLFDFGKANISDLDSFFKSIETGKFKTSQLRQLKAETNALAQFMSIKHVLSDTYNTSNGLRKYIIAKDFIQSVVYRLLEDGINGVPVPEWGIYDETFNIIGKEINQLKRNIKALTGIKKQEVKDRLDALTELQNIYNNRTVYSYIYQNLFPETITAKSNVNVADLYNEKFNSEESLDEAVVTDSFEDESVVIEDKTENLNIRNETRDLETQDAQKSLTTVIKQFLSRVPERKRVIVDNKWTWETTGKFLNPTEAYTNLLRISEYLDIEQLMEAIQGPEYLRYPDAVFNYLHNKFKGEDYYSLIEHLRENVLNKIPVAYTSNSIKVKNPKTGKYEWQYVPEDKVLVSYLDPHTNKTTYYYVASNSKEKDTLNKEDKNIFNIQRILKLPLSKRKEEEVIVIPYNQGDDAFTSFEGFIRKIINTTNETAKALVLERNKLDKLVKNNVASIVVINKDIQLLKKLNKEESLTQIKNLEVKKVELEEKNKELNQEINNINEKLDVLYKDETFRRDFLNMYHVMNAQRFVKAYHNTVGSLKTVDYMFSETKVEMGKYTLAYKKLTNVSAQQNLIADINNGLGSKLTELLKESKPLPAHMKDKTYKGFLSFMKEIGIEQSDMNITENIFKDLLTNKWEYFIDELVKDNEMSVQDQISNLSSYIRNISSVVAKNKVGSRKTSITSAGGKLIYLEQLSTKLDDIIRTLINLPKNSSFEGTTEEGLSVNKTPEHLTTNYFRNNIFVWGLNRIYGITTFDANKNAYNGQVKEYASENTQEWYRRNFVAYFLDAVGVPSQDNLRYKQPFFPLESRERMHEVEMDILNKDSIRKGFMALLLQLKDRNELISELYNQKAVKDGAKEGLLQTNLMFKDEDGKELLPRDVFEKLLNENKFDDIWNIVEKGLKASALRSSKNMINNRIFLPYNLRELVTKLRTKNLGMSTLSKEAIAHLDSMTKENEHIFSNKRGKDYLLTEPLNREIVNWLSEIYTYNNFLNGFFLNQLVGGDFVMYKDASDIIKRWAGVSAAGMKLLTNNFFGTNEKYRVVICKDYAVGEWLNDKNNPEAVETKKEIAALVEQIKSLQKDKENNNEWTDVKALELDIALNELESYESNSRKGSIELFLQRLMSQSGLSIQEQTDIINGIQNYFGDSFDLSNAQSFMTVRRWADLREGADDAFKLAYVTKPVHYGHEIFEQAVDKTVYESEEKAQEAINKLVKSKKERNINLGISKINENNYNYFIKEVENNKNEIIGYQIYENWSTPVYLKTSSIVLTDDLISKFPQLKAVKELLEKENIDELHFKTGIKVGSPKQQYDIAAHIEGTNTQDINLSILELSNKNYRIQYNPQSHLNAKVALFTQLLYFTAVSTEDLAKSEAIYRSLSYLIEQGIADEETEWRLDNAIQTAINKLSNGDENADFLEVLSQTGNLNSPMLDSKLITAMASSMSNATTLQKFNKSGKFVLQSSVFTDDQNRVRFDTRQSNKPLLFKIENGKLYAECYLPKNFFTDNPQLQSSIEKGEIMFDNLDLFGFRIPSTEIHSGILLRVVGYHTEDSTTVIVPKEVPAIAGSDFDVDALFVVKRQYSSKHVVRPRVVYDPIYDANGNEISTVKRYVDVNKEIKESLKITNEQDKDLIKSYNNVIVEKYDFLGFIPNEQGKYIIDPDKKLLNSIKNELIWANNSILQIERKGLNLSEDDKENIKVLKQYVKDLKKTEKDAVRNIIIENTMAVMADPNNLKRMLTPISLDFIKDTKNPNSTYSMLKQLGYEDLIGMKFNVALPDEQHEMFKIIFAGASLTGINANDMKVFAYMLLGGTNEEGKIERSFNYPKLNVDNQFTWLGENYTGIEEKTKDGMSMWQIKDSMVNAAIDNVKELVLGIINANMSTINAFNALIGLGMPFNDIVILMYQPVVKIFGENDFQGNKTEAINKMRTLLKIAIALKHKDLDGSKLKDATFKNDYVNRIYSELSKSLETDVTKKDAYKYARKGNDNIKNLLSSILEDNNGSNANLVTERLKDVSVEDLMNQMEVLEIYEKATAIGEQTAKVSKLLSVLRSSKTTLEEIYEIRNLINEMFIFEEDKSYHKSYVDYEDHLNKREIELVPKKDLPLDMTNFLQANPHIVSAIKSMNSLINTIESTLLLHNPLLTKALFSFNDSMAKLRLTKQTGQMSETKDEVLIRREFSKFIQAQVILSKLDNYKSLIKPMDIAIDVDGVTELVSIEGADAFKQRLTEKIKAAKAKEKELYSSLSKYELNAFLANLRIVNNKDSINRITFTTSANLKETELAQFNTAFTKLAELDPDLPELLTIYAGLEYGFRKSRNNFVGLIPVEYKAEYEALYEAELSKLIYDIDAINRVDLSEESKDTPEVLDRLRKIRNERTALFLQFYLNMYMMNSRKLKEEFTGDGTRITDIYSNRKFKFYDRKKKQIISGNNAKDYAGKLGKSYHDLALKLNLKKDKLHKFVSVKGNAYVLADIKVQTEETAIAQYIKLGRLNSWQKFNPNFSLARILDTNFLNVETVKIENKENGKAILHTPQDLSRFMNGDLFISANSSVDVNKTINAYKVINKLSDTKDDVYLYEVAKVIETPTIETNETALEDINLYYSILENVLTKEQENLNDACEL